MRDPEDTVWYNRKPLIVRNTDELIGICKGVIADKKVCCDEAIFLYQWVVANEDMIDKFPVCNFFPRLVEMLEDNKLDDEEAKELLQLLRNASGNDGQNASENTTIGINYTNPIPNIKIEGSKFCLTGTFGEGRGHRKIIEEQIIKLGGTIISKIPKTSSCIVVVGGLATKDWLHSTHGTKLRDAMEMQKTKKSIVIVRESDFNTILNEEM